MADWILFVVSLVNVGVAWWNYRNWRVVRKAQRGEA